MKALGTVLCIIGAIGLVVSLNMDTTASTSSKQVWGGDRWIDDPNSRIHNIGLIDERHTYILLSSLALIVGVILFGFGELTAAQLRANSPRTEEQKQLEYETERRRFEERENQRRIHEVRQRQAAERRQKISNRIKLIAKSLRRLPYAVDGILHNAVGPDNKILYRFVQIAAYVGLPLVIVALIITFCS